MTLLDVLVPQDTVLPQIATPCQGKLDESRAWHSTVAVRTGPVIVGVRADTADTARWLAEALEPVRAPEFDVSVSPNFSVTLGASRSREKLMLVYHDHEIVGRRRDSDELLVDLIELLDESPRLFVSDQAVVHASAVWNRRGDVLLVPGHQHSNLLMRRAQLQDYGLQISSSRSQVVDLTSLEISLGCVDAALEELRTTHAWEQNSHSALVVKTWCIPAAGEQIFDLRPPEAVMATVGMVLNRLVAGMGPTLRGLARAVGRVRVVGLPTLSTGAQASSVIDLVGEQGEGPAG